MPRQSGFLSILIVILIAVITLAGGYFVYQKSKVTIVQPVIQLKPIPSPTPSESTSSTETVNWKTYTNNKHKFTFKYPLEFSIREENNIIDLLEKDACCDRKFQIWLGDSKFEDSKTLVSCDKAIEEFKHNPSLPRGNCLEDGKRNGQNMDIVSIELDGIKAISFYVADTGVGHLDRVIQTQQEPRIQILYPPGSIYDQILSTFKFLP